MFCHFLIWCPGSGVVLDYVDSCSLPSSFTIHNIDNPYSEKMVIKSCVSLFTAAKKAE